MLTEPSASFPNQRHAAEMDRHRNRRPDCSLEQEWKPCKRNKRNCYLRPVEVFEVHGGIAGNDGAYLASQNMVVVELIRVTVRDQTRGNGKLKEVLEFYVPGAIKDPGHRVIDHNRSPQTDGKQGGVGAKAASGEFGSCPCNPSKRLRFWCSHGIGSAFFSASSMDWPERATLSAMRQPSS